MTHVKTDKGQQWHAHVAGPCHWFACHPSRRTKPCLHEVTGGQLLCPLCSSAPLVEAVGYMPLYRELDSRPCFVVVRLFTREQIDALKLHQRVLVGRGEEQSDGVYVVPALNPNPRFVSAVAWKQRPADLTETLLKVWGVPALTAWYRETHGVMSDKPVSLNTISPRADADTPATERVAENWKRTAYQDYLAQVGTGGAIEPPVGVNGKHKKK